jgi:hypothetical protein
MIWLHKRQDRKWKGISKIFNETMGNIFKICDKIETNKLKN